MTHTEKQKAFVDMVKRYEQLILRVCALYTDGRRSELCDLYQDAVCALWESYDTFRGDSHVSTWIYAVTRHTMLNIMRRKQLVTTTLGENEMNVAAEETDGAIEELREAVGLLPPDDRDIFIMWMEGFKLGEIGEVVGLNYGTVATRLSRIKNKLRAIINNNREVRL